jgi:lysophospholipase L1-like esterase
MTLGWIAGFRASVIDPHGDRLLASPRGFADQTVRQVLHLAGGGAQLRVRLSNRYGRTPLVLGPVRVALRKAEAAIVPETDTAVRFGGRDRVVVAPGAEIVSDDVALVVRPGDDLALSLYLPEPTGLADFAQDPREAGYLIAGNRTADADLEDAEQFGQRFYVTGVDVLADAATPVVVAFGDSWFEGTGSTFGANRRAVDLVNARLTRGWLVNQGVSGNQLVADRIGESGLGRFDRDVLAVPGVRTVLVNLGINDVAVDGATPAAAVIAGYRELARRAHAAGLRIYANTIGPFAGVIYAGVDVAAALPVRRELNEWLRGTDVFDAVFDVAAAVADPADPDRLRADLDSGDGLHLNDAGARIMAEAMRIPED